MRALGVSYDVGTPRTVGGSTRPRLTADRLATDADAIAGDLRCTAVRVSGADVGRLERAADAFLARGLAVWLSPALHETPRAAALDVVTGVAEAAARLRAAHRSDGPRVPAIGVLVGCEVSIAMPGFVPGGTLTERLAVFRRPWRLLGPLLREGSPARRLNAFLGEAAAGVRRAGPPEVRIGYAAGPWEPVDWKPFDVVGLDHYLGRGGLPRYEAALRRAVVGRREAPWRPLVVTELGCATYRGAAARGGAAWAVLQPDPHGGGQRLAPGVVRDEGEQARAVVAQLDACERAGAEEAYVFTFAAPALPHRPDDAAHDLDASSYALVATAPGDADAGAAWTPKPAFGAVAGWAAAWHERMAAC